MRQKQQLAWVIILTFGLMGFCGTSVLNAQFSIYWHKIAGGGGNAAGGNFELQGTIGQHDAGMLMSGGGFALAGGFWHGAMDTRVLPDSFKLADGVLVSGGLSELLASDDQDFQASPSPTQNLLKQRIDLILQSASPTPWPTTLNFRVESSMTGGPAGDVIQTVELFNYATNRRELVDSRAVQNTDESIEIDPGGDLSRFVNQLNGEITAIVIWKSESFSGGQFTWSIDVDETVWSVSD